MVIYGLGGNEELFGDLLILQAIPEQFQYFELSGGELGGILAGSLLPAPGDAPDPFRPHPELEALHNGGRTKLFE